VNWNALLPEIILSLGILVLFVLELFSERKHFRVLLLLAALLPIVALFSLFFVNFPARTLFDVFEVNRLNLVGKGFIYLLTSLFLFSLQDYYEKKDSSYNELSYLPLLSTLGLSTLLSSVNLGLLFLSLELSSITIYIMIALLRRDYLSKEGSFKYLVIGAVGTAMLALGSAFYYASTGSMFVVGYSKENSLFLLSLFFIMSALALKISAVPYHFWTPDAYEGAPTPITAYLSTVPKLSLYFLLVNLLAYFSHLKQWLILLAVLSLLSMFYANLVAYVQRSVKRLLAYSSIAHAGYFLLGLSLSDPQLQSALLFYVSVYTLATLGSFTVLTILEKREGFSHHLLDYRGLYSQHPVLSSLFALFLFSTVGIPPMALFVGKLGIFLGLVNSGLFPLALAFVVGSLLSVGYYLRVVVAMFLEEGQRKFEPAKTSSGEAVTLLLCSLGVILFGLFPQLIYNLLSL
jgi:NADH-quinone oxidoreductase subunit N